jgi:hypothetical protein
MILTVNSRGLTEYIPMRKSYHYFLYVVVVRGGRLYTQLLSIFCHEIFKVSEDRFLFLYDTILF